MSSIKRTSVVVVVVVVVLSHGVSLAPGSIESVVYSEI